MCTITELVYYNRNHVVHCWRGTFYRIRMEFILLQTVHNMQVAVVVAADLIAELGLNQS